MFTALSIALGATSFSVAFLAAWVIDLRARSLKQDAELKSLQGTLDRVAQDVVTLWSGERRRLLAERVNAVPAELARHAELARRAEPDAGPPLECAPVLPAAPMETMIHEGPLEPPPPGRSAPPDAADLLVRSLAGGDRGPRDASPGAAVIWGAQEELALVAGMLRGINTKSREACPEPSAIGNVLTALSDRILAGLELLAHERDSAPPSSSPVADEDDELPPSSDSGGGPVMKH